MTYNEYRAKQVRIRRAETEKAESMQYYNDHKEEIEVGRKAALLLSALRRMSAVFRYIDIKDILCKVNNTELNFYYYWLCEVKMYE